MAASSKITLAEVRQHDHGVLYGERTMGHTLAYFGTAQRPIELCPARLAKELQLALAGGGSVGKPPIGHYRIISRRRNGMMNASLAETSGSIGHDETAETVKMNRQDAAAAGIVAGELVDIRSDLGSIRVRTLLSDEIRRGVVVLAQGWSSPLFDPKNSSEVFRRGQDRNKLVSDADLDPLSAVPRLNGTLVTIARIERTMQLAG